MLVGRSARPKRASRRSASASRQLSAGWRLRPTSHGRRAARRCDYLVKKSVWIVGGDGWAYDIGYGGLDHVLASGANVNMLVLDTEVYSNTGGQQSKATPTGAAAKFAVAGKSGGKKDLGLMAMSYGHVYVAQVAFGAKDAQTVKAFSGGRSRTDGPSLIIAYSHCIAHGYDMACGLEHQRLAADTGYWPLYGSIRGARATGQPPLVLDSPPPKADVSHADGAWKRGSSSPINRITSTMRQLIDRARHQIAKRVALYQELATPYGDGAASAPLSGRSKGVMIVLKKVLVATDFSEPSDAALAYGRELALTFGAQLVVAHVAENTLTRGFGGGDGFVFVDPALQRSVEASARRQLETLISDEDREQLCTPPQWCSHPMCRRTPSPSTRRKPRSI